MLKFIHAADLHLDSPLRGLSRYEGAPVEALRGATRRALENLVDFAIKEDVAFLVIAGDLYDGDWKDYNTAQFFAHQMARLDRVGIQVVLISGNHDAQSKLTRQLSLPPSVRTLSVHAPETIILDRYEVAIHGQGFDRPEVTRDLSACYPEPMAHVFNLGLLHTCLDGREGHARYAPCTLEGLRQHGYDYWALGHVHQRELLCSDPPILFPGNLQGRHVREQGEKGATLVMVDEGKVVDLTHVSFDVVRWQQLRVDLKGVDHTDEALARVRYELERAVEGAEGRMLAVRFELTCPGTLSQQMLADEERWVNEVRALGHQMARDVWIEKVKWRLQEEATEPTGIQAEVLGSILEGIKHLSEDTEELQALGDEALAELERKLPRLWREGVDALDLRSPELLRELLQGAGTLIQGRLTTEDRF